MHNFCTLFDSNYLPRALVMYHSLARTGDEFTLYAACFDARAHRILTELGLPRLVAIPLEAFETPRLRAVKAGRTAGEYCWTCTPHVIRFVLDAYGLPQVTYLDADLCLYDKPSLLLDEMRQAGASILITPHRYTPRYDRTATSGIYCVQFMTFNHDSRGLKALEWWQERCLEWCFARFEEGKFGDQKYLDDWPQRFEGVHVLDHIGGGVAPWNVQKYAITADSSGLRVNEGPLIFYHFHEYHYYVGGTHDFGPYYLPNDVVKMLYLPYAKKLLGAHQQIQEVDASFDRGWSVPEPAWLAWARRLKRLLQGVSNQYRIV